MIRVLVADDSATARGLLVAILRNDPELQVVGEAEDGLKAVELTQKLRPQVVTMDVRMPRMDGFAASKEIMITAPTPIVIVTASHDGREVEVALNALRVGAVSVLQKPPGPESSTFEEESRKLISTVKAMAQVKVVRHWRSTPSVSSPLPVSLSPGLRPSESETWRQGDKEIRRSGEVVAVATSTGGPAALHHLLSELPGDFPVPILVVQHITRGITPGLGVWLNTSSSLRVKIAEQREALRPGSVYLAPDDRHLGMSSRSTIALSDSPPIGGFRPSGTFLFESVSRVFGASAIALMLTGMGEDGVKGLRQVRQAGGRIVAQDEKSSVIFGMPGAAIAAGLADMVLPIEAIPGRLLEMVRREDP
jgi:two-component system chemotaxis response regulator CheB